MDFIMALPRSQAGNTSILVFVDRLTKQTHLVPCKKKIDASKTARIFFNTVVKLHGTPLDVVHDRGVQFTSKFWKQLNSLLGVELNYSSAYHPQSDGQTERVNRVIGTMLRNLIDQENPANWEQCLPMAEFAINNAVNRSTGQSPFYLNFGYNPRSPALHAAREVSPAGTHAAETLVSRLQRAKRAMQAAREYAKEYYDKQHTPQVFKVNDTVLLSTKNLRIKQPSKLVPKYIGPFRVSEVINSQAYRLELPESLQIHSVFHTSLLRPYYGTAQPSLVPVAWSDGPVFEIDAVIAERSIPVHPRSRRFRQEFRVRWRQPAGSAVPLQDAETWEPEASVPADLVAAFRAGAAGAAPMDTEDGIPPEGGLLL